MHGLKAKLEAISTQRCAFAQPHWHSRESPSLSHTRWRAAPRCCGLGAGCGPGTPRACAPSCRAVTTQLPMNASWLSPALPHGGPIANMGHVPWFHAGAGWGDAPCSPPCPSHAPCHGGISRMPGSFPACAGGLGKQLLSPSFAVPTITSPFPGPLRVVYSSYGLSLQELQQRGDWYGMKT